MGTWDWNDSTKWLFHDGASPFGASVRFPRVAPEIRVQRFQRMSRPKRGKSTALIDRHVGARIRERRIMLGLTQQQLAELIGVTYQQAHKYERGVNRVSAGRLFNIAKVLSVPISYFYEGVGAEEPRAISQRERMVLEIARNFTGISNERHQEALSQLARALAEGTRPGEPEPVPVPTAG